MKLFPLLFFNLRSPFNLLALGVLCTVLGIRQFYKVYQGDTLMPGTNFTYLPNWFFYLTGALLQIPLPLACWFLHSVGRI
ncbi:MAG: hypothetical protein ACOVRB_08835 [Akkermansiaceae bacterium]